MTNVTVTGDGTIDGNGAWWWARHKVPGKEQFTRGHLIEFMCTLLKCEFQYLETLGFREREREREREDADV